MKSYEDGLFAGYHERDEEVKKLVEVLKELIEWFDFGSDWFEYPEKADKAKEALKPYEAIPPNI